MTAGDAANQVDVRHGVEREAAHNLGRGVAVPQGHVAVRHLVNNDRKDEDHGHGGEFQDIGKV